MMDAGRVVLDIGGEERKGLTVDDLLERFRAGAGRTWTRPHFALQRLENAAQRRHFFRVCGSGAMYPRLRRE